jgi:hypothetical protein
VGRRRKKAGNFDFVGERRIKVKRKVVRMKDLDFDLVHYSFVSASLK